MPLVYGISDECLARDYHGCGRAWAAIVDGQVAALRYMADSAIDLSAVPAWLRAVWSACGLDSRAMPVARSSRQYAALAREAEACSDCPHPSKRDRYRPIELLRMAREAKAAMETSAFAAYRQRCRAELGEIGEVVSGMCSCTEFVV